MAEQLETSREGQTHTSALWVEHTQEAELDSSWLLGACTSEVALADVLML